MPSNNSKYTQEFRDRTVKHILESGNSATGVAEDMGIDTNWNGSSFVEHGVVKRMHTDVEQQEVLPKSGQPDNRGIRFWSPLVFLWLKRKSAKSHIS